MSGTQKPGRSKVAIAGKGKLTVKATSQTLVLEHRQRQSIYIFNPSSKEVWLSLGEAAAVAKEGIWLKKEVGSVYIPDFTGQINCITTEGEGDISFSEV